MLQEGRRQSLQELREVYARVSEEDLASELQGGPCRDDRRPRCRVKHTRCFMVSFPVPCCFLRLPSLNASSDRAACDKRSFGLRNRSVAHLVDGRTRSWQHANVVNSVGCVRQRTRGVGASSPCYYSQPYGAGRREHGVISTPSAQLLARLSTLKNSKARGATPPHGLFPDLEASDAPRTTRSDTSDERCVD